jgi:thiol-disulfide isomerase/thioredoxin
MKRVLFCSALLCSLTGVWLANADDKSPAAQDLAKLQKKFEEEEKALKKKIADAKSGEDREQAAFLLKELYAFTASDALDIADENKKDEVGLEAAVLALKLLGQNKAKGPEIDKATNIVMGHVDSPKISGAFAQIVELGQPGLEFLKTVSEKTTNKDVQGMAFYYTALAMDIAATRQEGLGNLEMATRTRGEAVDMMEKAVKTAPQAKIGDKTLAKAAEIEIANIKIGVGFPIPDVEGTDLDGKKVRMSSYKGKVVLFDFWATWCGPCVAMIPHERDLAIKMAQKPFVLLSVNVDEDKETLKEFMKNEKMPWDHWFDGEKGPISKQFKINAFPTLFLIDAKGIVRKKWIGSPGNDVLDKAVAELVTEAQKMKP